ncbi:sensor histidine kinase [Mesoterricola silvestris]|nr:ATP-binding protein [Mesoterricola silvestris]
MTLPLLPWAAALAGGALMASDIEPVLRVAGFLAAAAGGVSLALAMRRHRESMARLLAVLPVPEKGDEVYRALPRAWAALEAENHRLATEVEAEDQVRRQILANLRTGIVLLGLDRQIRLFNPKARTILGASSHLGEGESLVSAFREPESLRNLQDAYGGAFREWTLKRNPRTIRLRAVPFPAPGEEGTWVLVTLDDITHFEALETTRQKFISNASHELKTPVTGIRVAVENLQDGGLVLAEGETSLKIILRSLDRMVMLLDDISELSRIETGALRLDPRPLTAGPFMAEFMESVEPLGRARNVRIRAEVDPAVRDHAFRADPMRLGQLLENLVSNAVKFGPPDSEVRVEARLEGEVLAFAVADQGPGIGGQDLPRVFERFFRAPATRAVPGTGLGLSIVKHLAVLMGGEVDVASELGHGATFTFRLPPSDTKA